MNAINDDVVRAIITAEYPKSTIRITNWDIDNNIVKAGVNYSTEVQRLTIHYERDQQAPSSTVLFVKIPTNAAAYEIMSKFDGYANEMLVYTKVLPQMYHYDDDRFTPTHHYNDHNMTLFLEDLSRTGYKCADRVDQLDFEHCFYALRCLAKFHALSVKLERTVGLPESVKRDPMDGTGRQTDEVIDSYLQSIPIYVQSLPQRLRDQYPDTIAYVERIDRPTLLKCVTQASSRFSVLTHGDFWTTNIMFQYDKLRAAVKNVKIIDFQMTGWKTPAEDLIFFTISSMKYQTYREYFPLLMSVYVDTLNRSLSQLDCPGYDLPSLLRDIDDMYPFAWMALCCVLPFTVSDPDDPMDAKELCKNDTLEMSSSAKVMKQARFKEISSAWFIHLAKTGTLSKNEHRHEDASDVTT